MYACSPCACICKTLFSNTTHEPCMYICMYVCMRTQRMCLQDTLWQHHRQTIYAYMCACMHAPPVHVSARRSSATPQTNHVCIYVCIYVCMLTQRMCLQDALWQHHRQTTIPNTKRTVPMCSLLMITLCCCAIRK